MLFYFNLTANEEGFRGTFYMMKTLKLLCIAFIAALAVSSCGSSKDASYSPKKTKVSTDECVEYALKSPTTRSYGEGVSFSESTATNKAELEARAKFSRAISSSVKNALSQDDADYRKASSNGNKSSMGFDEGSKYNEMSISISENVIKNTAIVKTSKYLLKDGSYQVYVCLEYLGDISKMAEDITQKVNQQISDEERMKMNFEFEKFRQRVEEELKNSKANE